MIGRTSLDVARRGFWSVSVPQFNGSGGAFVTKYRIVKPGREGTAWDDFLLALPEKDHLAKFSKELPLFIRYLRVLTEKEGRQADLHTFVERAKDGLEVESDVFISTQELLAVMWKNGYSQQERNAIQFTFPGDYKFHYPELAVMFDLAEEDTYKFCMRTRMEKSHIGELDANKITRKGLIRDHWILFGVGAFIMKTFPFYNYYFILKGFGTGLWFVSGYMLTSRFFLRAAARNDYMAQQKTAQEVMDGESKIMTAMKRFARDAECVDFLKSFKGDLQTKLTSYRLAIVEQHKAELARRANKQLQNIAVFENQMNHQLQEMVVRETASAFKANSAAPGTQKAFMDAALIAVAGGKMEKDPITLQFNAAMEELQHIDLMTAPANPEGTIVERVAYAQQNKEKEFRNSFMVTQAEANEVRSLAQNAKTSDGEYNFTKLSEEQAARLEHLFTVINNKVGFYVPTESVTPVEGNGAAEEYVTAVNAEISATNAKVRDERLKAFVAAF
eukprot:GEMP01021496.1.p1 GENE.GEMP01021496.1~~GEMP01021496.1.p1  ORF type:complete len:503 (+),score=132.45 GEMP01021496.1:33-1541(+)